MNLNNIIATRPSKKIYRDGDKVIKLFDCDYKKSDILNEALNQARVEETGLPVPKIIEVTKIENSWAIISEYIEGETLAELIAKNPSKKDEYLEMLVDLQMQIHSKKSPLLNKLKDKMQGKISSTDLDATTRYDLHTRLESMPKHNKVCHGDFDTTNVVMTADGSLHVLDWAHATQGNASADAARTYLLFCLEGDTEGADKYMDLFCKKSDTAKQYVQQWLPIVAASQLVKHKKEEKEFLLRWIDVVDYE